MREKHIIILYKVASIKLIFIQSVGWRYSSAHCFSQTTHLIFFSSTISYNKLFLIPLMLLLVIIHTTLKHFTYFNTKRLFDIYAIIIVLIIQKCLIILQTRVYQFILIFSTPFCIIYSCPE